MAEAYDQQQIFYLNLIDCGCDRKEAEYCLSLYRKKETEALLSFLMEKRKSLLLYLHQSQENLDHLDYLTYHLRKKNHS